MKRFSFVACLLFVLPGLAGADIVWNVPSEAISNSSSTGSFTVTATFSGSYDVSGYGIDLRLTPESGATGLSFNGASEATSNYVFTVPRVHYGSSISNGTRIYGEDYVSTGTETIAGGTKNLITVNLTVAPGAHGVYDVTFNSAFTGFNDELGDPFAGQTFGSGTITVTPEPMTICLFAIGGLGALARLRRRPRAA
jgi:hypothetical protein